MIDLYDMRCRPSSGLHVGGSVERSVGLLWAIVVFYNSVFVTIVKMEEASLTAVSPYSVVELASIYQRAV